MKEAYCDYYDYYDYYDKEPCSPDAVVRRSQDQRACEGDGMNDQEIKKMLEEALKIQKEEITKAAMAAAAMAIDKAIEVEREACAKVCDARVIGDHNREDQEAKRCAAAIRARGEA